MLKVRCLVVKPNWSVERVSSRPKLLRTNLWKSIHVHLKRGNKVTSWFDSKGWILWKDWIKTLTTVQLWSIKAMTVFYTKLLLWFKPFNGFFHLKALVWCLACVCGVISELVNCCPLAARTRRCVSAVTITAVLCFLCCDWMLMKHFVLPHRAFTCPSDTRLPIRRRISGPPLSFGTRGARPSFWGRRENAKPKRFVALQRTVGVFVRGVSAEYLSQRFSNTLCTKKKNPCCKTRIRLSPGAPILSCMSNNQIGVLPN